MNIELAGSIALICCGFAILIMAVAFVILVTKEK